MAYNDKTRPLTCCLGEALIRTGLPLGVALYSTGQKIADKKFNISDGSKWQDWGNISSSGKIIPTNPVVSVSYFRYIIILAVV